MSGCSLAQRQQCRAKRQWDEANTESQQNKLVSEVLASLEALDLDPAVSGLLKPMAISAVWCDHGRLILDKGGVMVKGWFLMAPRDEDVYIHYTEDLDRTRDVIIHSKLSSLEVADVRAAIQPWELQDAIAT